MTFALATIVAGLCLMALFFMFSIIVVAIEARWRR